VTPRPRRSATPSTTVRLEPADIAEVWRRGSVVASWLLDLTAISLLESPDLGRFSGACRTRARDAGPSWRRSTRDAGRGLTTSLYARFTSRGEADFQNKLLSAMRFQFGGHHEKPAK